MCKTKKNTYPFWRHLLVSLRGAICHYSLIQTAREDTKTGHWPPIGHACSLRSWNNAIHYGNLQNCRRAWHHLKVLLSTLSLQSHDLYFQAEYSLPRAVLRRGGQLLVLEPLLVLPLDCRFQNQLAQCPRSLRWTPLLPHREPATLPLFAELPAGQYKIVRVRRLKETDSPRGSINPHLGTSNTQAG